MENNIEKQEFDLSLASLFRIFKGKLKTLIAIGIVAALLGGVIGTLTVTMSKKNYGNILAFHLPTPEQASYASVIPLLDSDVFAENILIGTKNIEFTDSEGKEVDVKIPDLPYTAEQEELLAQYEYDKISATKKIKDLKERINELPFDMEILKTDLTNAEAKYSQISNELSFYLKVQVDALTNLEKINELEAQLSEAMIKMTEAKEAYNAALNEFQLAEQGIFLADKKYTEATEDSEKLLATLRSEWRAKTENRELLETVHENVTYSFTLGEPLPNEKTTTEKKDTGKFLYVTVEIPEDKALANRIINNINEQISEFIISNTTPLEKNDSIECISISSGEAKNVNETSLIKNALIFALVFFAVAEVLVCGLIIFSYFKKIVYASDSQKLPEASSANSSEAENANDTAEADEADGKNE